MTYADSVARKEFAKVFTIPLFHPFYWCKPLNDDWQWVYRLSFWGLATESFSFELVGQNIQNRLMIVSNGDTVRSRKVVQIMTRKWTYNWSIQVAHCLWSQLTQTRRQQSRRMCTSFRLVRKIQQQNCFIDQQIDGTEHCSHDRSLRRSNGDWSTSPYRM